MKLDVCFIDAACSKPYDDFSLENDSLGGTEQSTIRLAEGLASKGHSVAVIQRFDRDVTQSENGVHYLPAYTSKIVKAKNTIFIRACGRWEEFPDTRKFLWLHDASRVDHNNMSTWVSGMVKHSVQGIAVSDWHIKNLLEISPGMPLKRVYSPVDELAYSHPRDPSLVDKNQLVWLSSPHKGLKEALILFKRLRQKCPDFKLAVFNPGYYEEDQGLHENVVFIPEASKRVVRNVLSKSLCLFYPTQFEETFGLVAAESNALGVPVASYKVAALAESSQGPFADSEDQLIEQVLSWRGTERPVLTGNEAFRFDRIYPEWANLLDL